jgi:hypothetical protein
MARVKHIPRPGKRTRRSSSSNGKFQFLKPSFSQFHIFLSQFTHFKIIFQQMSLRKRRKEGTDQEQLRFARFVNFKRLLTCLYLVLRLLDA